MSTGKQYENGTHNSYPPDVKQNDPRYYQPHQANQYTPQRYPEPPSPVSTQYTASAYTTASLQYTTSSQFTESSQFTDRATVDYSVNRYGETPSPVSTTYFRRPSSQRSSQPPYPQTLVSQRPNQGSQSRVNSPISPFVARAPYPQTPAPQWPNHGSHDYANTTVSSSNVNVLYPQMPVSQWSNHVNSPVSPSMASVSTGFYPESEYESITQPQPQRPRMPAHQFSVPYIATPHDPVPHVVAAQFEHPNQPGLAHTSQNSLAAPLLRPRPLSAPVGLREDWGTDNRAEPVTNPATPAYHEASLASPSSEHKDDFKSHRVARFLGNTMAGRVGRATVQSLQSTAKLPYYLSPWGDNNPVTLPNIRRRDFVLAGILHVGVETLAPSAVTMIEKSIQKAAEFTIEEAADLGINIWGGRNGQKIKRRVGLNSLELRISHKLIGEEASLVFHGQRKAADKRSCAKGWFCPYLYCSGRSTDLERSRDFSVVELRGPGLAADASIAPTLLSSFAETAAPIAHICPWELTHPTYPRYRRMAIFVAGISPYRTATAWSQARIPNEARVSFHLVAHIPALVVPVIAEAPVLAWSSWTVAQMLIGRRGGQSSEANYKLSKKLKNDEHLAYGDASFLEREEKESRYDERNHFQELMNFLEGVVDPNLMQGDTRARWKSLVGEAVQAMLDAVLSVPDAIRATVVGHCELERAGFVMFRY